MESAAVGTASLTTAHRAPAARHTPSRGAQSRRKRLSFSVVRTSGYHRLLEEGEKRTDEVMPRVYRVNGMVDREQTFKKES